MELTITSTLLTLPNLNTYQLQLDLLKDVSKLIASHVQANARLVNLLQNVANVRLEELIHLNVIVLRINLKMIKVFVKNVALNAKPVQQLQIHVQNVPN